MLKTKDPAQDSEHDAQQFPRDPADALRQLEEGVQHRHQREGLERAWFVEYVDLGQHGGHLRLGSRWFQMTLTRSEVGLGRWEGG